MPKFSIQDEIYSFALTKERHIHSENCNDLIVATNTNGPYLPNIFHNYRTGMYYRKAGGLCDVLIPFIYKDIKRFKFSFSLSDEIENDAVYYIAKYDIPEGTFYSIYLESDIPFVCLAKFIEKEVTVNQRLRFLKYVVNGKMGIIRNGEVCIPPQYDNISANKLSFLTYKGDEMYNRFMVVFVVTHQKKRGLYLENQVILPPEYDSISVESGTGTCMITKENHFYIGGFKDDNHNFSIREISEEEYLSVFEEEKEQEDYVNDWSEEDTWIALTDGQYGEYPGKGLVNWDVLDDYEGR